jgi:hypothetical protein
MRSHGKARDIYVGGMSASVMLLCKDVVRTDVSKEYIASINKEPRIGELGTTLAVTSNRSTLRRNTRRNISGDSILHRHCRGNLTSDITLTVWAM